MWLERFDGSGDVPIEERQVLTGKRSVVHLQYISSERVEETVPQFAVGERGELSTGLTWFLPLPSALLS